MKTTESTRFDIAQLHRVEYESSPDIVVSAPGLVRLVGDHTTGSGGAFIGMPMDRRVWVAMSPRRDASIRFYAADLNERKRTNVSNLKYKREDRWANVIKGALAAFGEGREAGRGFNVTVAGDVPQDLGLGSAQAMLCAAARAAAALAGAPSDDSTIERAIMGMDREYFERPARLADYLGTIRARDGALIYVDAERQSAELVPAPFGDAVLLMTDSKVPRPPVDAELDSRSEDCRLGLARLGTGDPGSYSAADLDEFMGTMPERVRRHCAFLLDEVQRAREARDAAERGDLASFARTLNKSQAGLRNHYEISCPEIDWLVKRAMEIEGVMASRMTGKGFGGCTLTILEQKAMDEYMKRLDEYERIFGFKPVPWRITVGSGMMTHPARP